MWRQHSGPSTSLCHQFEKKGLLVKHNKIYQWPNQHTRIANGLLSPKCAFKMAICLGKVVSAFEKSYY
jgi:hypothetical protein